MRYMSILCVVTLVLVTLPGAVASHEDPTHGVAPHTASEDPTNIHPVNVSTPHPYPRGQTFSWTVDIEDAESLSVHFERYDVNGREDRRGGCTGSEVLLSDADSGEVLDTICGNTPGTDDFWTPFYDTDHLQIELQTNRGAGDNYGFDVYEVASDGAQALASVPYSPTPDADTETETGAELDPFRPTESHALAFVSAEASYAATGANGDGQAGVGKYLDCSTFFCREKEGNRVQLGGGGSVGTTSANADASVLVEEDEGEPAGYSASPEISCTFDGASCT